MQFMDPVPAEAQAADAPRINCCGCGCDVGSLTSDQVCRICGVPVARTLGDRSLRYSDPAWVRRITMGVDLLIGAAVLTFVVGTPVWIYLVDDEAIRQPGPAKFAFDTWQLLQVVFLAIATWLLTTAEPKPTLRHGPPSHGIRLRLVAIVMVGLYLAKMWPHTEMSHRMIEGFAWWLWMLVGIVTLMRLIDLHRRAITGESRLAHWLTCGLMAIIFGGVLAFTFAAVVFIAAAVGVDLGWFGQALENAAKVLSVLFMTAIPVVFLLAIVAMIFARLDFARVLREPRVESAV
jgi:hypothetical protein